MSSASSPSPSFVSTSLLYPTVHPPRYDEKEWIRLLTKYHYDSSENDDDGSNNNNSSKLYSYGTAGFREKANELLPIMVRIGIVAYLHAIIQNSSASSSSNNSKNKAVVGIMITASHNDESYNGVKIAQYPDGGMMNETSEKMATYVVNERNAHTLQQYVVTTIQQKQCENIVVTVHLGHDTREHSVSFNTLILKILCSMGCLVYDHGVITTPMLHHCVKHHQQSITISTGTRTTTTQCCNKTVHGGMYVPSLIPHSPNISGYYHLMIQSYLNLINTKQFSTADSSIVTEQQVVRNLYVDCACGVGYIHLCDIAKQIRNAQQQGQQQQTNFQSSTSSVAMVANIIPYNAPNSGPLNIGCGSEYVQKELKIPHQYDNTGTDQEQQQQEQYCASFDGDADRIVFFYTKKTMIAGTSLPGEEKKMGSTGTNTELRMLDGDKMSTLICHFLQQQLQTIQNGTLSSTSNSTSLELPTLRLGVVQTAYANGASTQYLRELLKGNGNGNNETENVRIAKTGVKYVHAVAHEYYDIGVYFEANGHGTVLFNSRFYQYIYCIEQHIQNSCNSHNEQDHGEYLSFTTEALVAYQRLRILPSLVNQAVGDAISDLLLIDAILYLLDDITNLSEWDEKLYTDLPSRQTKLQVVDRSIIKTNDNETKCLEPLGVQDAIDQIVNTMNKQSNSTLCRAFIRPSGTENVVRVYAEAPTRQQTDELTNQIVDVVYTMCGGIHEKPYFFFPQTTSKM